MIAQWDLPNGIERLNRALKPHALELNGVIVTPDTELNFNRNAPQDVIRQSYGGVITHLGAGLSVPQRYAPPDNSNQLAHRAVEAGYAGDSANLNRSGMGLVTSMCNLALGVSFADAPAAIIVHVPTGVLAAVSGIWHHLPNGTVDQTIDLMREAVEAQGHSFSPADLWILWAPGARARGFYINEDGRKLLLAGGEHYRQFIFDAKECKLDFRVARDENPFALDLSGLYRALWIRAGVPIRQIAFDDRNTVTDFALPCKRRADARKESYASGLIAATMRRLD